MSGPECCANPPEINNTFGNGALEDIAGIKAYISGDRSSNRAILIGSDAYGYDGVMLRKLADKIAALGYLAVLPDFFFGKPIGGISPPEIAKWLNENPPSKGCENAKKIIAELKSWGVSAVGAAGFCWGGLMVVKLAKYDDIKAGVVLHPGHLTEDEIHEIKAPIAILAAEFDDHCPQEDVKRFADILSAKPEVESFVKIYPGVSHGWAARYSEDDETAVKNAEEAHTDMMNWLTKYVK